MRLSVKIAVLCAVAVSPMALAQQAGTNVNVLPVVLPEDAPDDWFVIGDGFLQRQVEPTIAASTRNPDHLVAFFNDYRAVDIPDDAGLGQAEAVIAALNATRTFLLAGSWLSLPTVASAPIAAAEAWVGMSRSYDGGLTWSGAFLPGAPFDHSPASLAAPVYGLEAATDPVVAPGPCGKLYVVFMAFTRGGESKLVVARYQDLNNSEGGDSIVYQGMTVIESGNNATHGYFLDKPDIEVDIARGPGGDLCADAVYVSYSTFNGLDKDGKFQSKVSFARSFDGGLTFDTQKLNPPYNQNQGSALAVDPANGTIYMIWRHFFAPDAILMVRSTNLGGKWSKPVVLTGGPAMAPFDQPTIPTTVAPLQIPSDLNPGFPEVAFRSNGFPTATVTDQGTVVAAWQERVDIDPGSPDLGRPDPTGSPRIVVVRSTDGGRIWTDVDGLPNNRRAVDLADRDVPGSPDLPSPGFGLLPQWRPSGPQVMPKLSFGGGRLVLAYYESRGRIANYGSGTSSEWLTSEADPSPYTGFISGYDRVLDLRAALLDPATGDLLNEGSTTQVSRYPIRAGADLTDGEDLTDVAAVSSPCSPDSGPGYPSCIRQVNRANAPQSAAGTSPFIGDYVDLAPEIQFTFDGSGWRWASGPTDVPTRSFHAVFADNRHLAPPPGPNEWDGYQFYDAPYDSPPANLPGCLNPGSRNTDVLTARVSTALALSAPTTYKQLDDQRGFPISIRNQTDETRSYLVEIVVGAGSASFVRTNPDIDSGIVEIFPRSGTALMVYVDSGAVPPIRIQVSELPPCAGECATGAITLNLDPENPPIAALDGAADAQYPEVTDPFVINPFVINDGAANPFVINPFVINPFVINPFVINPFVINPFVINPFVINSPIEEVIDTTWTVTPGASNTASSYLPLVNIDNAQAFLDAGYVFQLIAYKGSLYGGLSGCGSANVAQPQILANVTQDPNDSVYNPFVINPFVINPFVINPFVINPFVINSTFTMAPSDGSADDGTTKAPPASSEVNITLRAFKLGGGAALKTGGLVYDPLLDPPSLVIVPLPCDPANPVNCNVFSLAPDLVPASVDPSPVTAPVGGTLTGFPAGGWDVVNQGYGDATAENGILRHGFAVCDPGYIASHPVDAVLDVSGPECALVPEFVPSAANTIPVGATEHLEPVDLTMPTLDEGDYALVLIVDDTKEVSEFNEVNNWLAVPITLVSPNQPPFFPVTSYDIDEDPVAPLTAVLAVDPDDDPLTYVVTSPPAHGIWEIVDGVFSYLPDPDFNGVDTFDVEVSDGELGAAATVTINVLPVNDPPTAGDASWETAENTPLTATLPGADIDGDALTFSILSGPAHGAAVIDDAATGIFTYTPNPGFVGVDGFVFEVADLETAATGSATITVYDPVPNWIFVGFDSPWRPNYKVNAGSAIPLKWRYTDPATGALVDSSAAMPEIRVTGFVPCGSTGTPLTWVEDPGSSDLRYVGGDWQFNWDTAGLDRGCYFLAIYHPTTDQLDTTSHLGDPLMIELK
ncbi:MAG: Ig-like domain-containing protein [Thermoanaerobaculales bacterium]|jgi:hypothetical protein|nr:Ig-like domain-containing protein [Thermoanaerobaculales bacterium]